MSLKVLEWLDFAVCGNGAGDLLPSRAGNRDPYVSRAESADGAHGDDEQEKDSNSNDQPLIRALVVSVISVGHEDFPEVQHP
jgi:hypothetical protein